MPLTLCGRRRHYIRCDRRETNCARSHNTPHCNWWRSRIERVAVMSGNCPLIKSPTDDGYGCLMNDYRCAHGMRLELATEQNATPVRLSELLRDAPLFFLCLRPLQCIYWIAKNTGHSPCTIYRRRQLPDDGPICITQTASG